MGVRAKNKADLKRDARQKKVAELVLAGITCKRELARRVGVVELTIYKDLRVIREQWRKDNKEAFDYARDEQLRRLDRIEEQAWRGWRRSVKPYLKTIRRVNFDGESEDTKVIEQQAGDPRFLDMVRKCCEDRRKLLGLDEPEKIDIRANLLVAATKLQETIRDNGEYIEYQRQLALGQCAVVAGDASNGDKQRTVAASTSPNASGYVAGTNGNGQTTITVPAKPARTRVRFDP